jgi:hypothetical protein
MVSVLYLHHRFREVLEHLARHNDWKFLQNGSAWGFESPLPHHAYGVMLHGVFRRSAFALRVRLSGTSPPFRTNVKKRGRFRPRRMANRQLTVSWSIS